MHQDALLESAPVLLRRPHRDTGRGQTLAKPCARASPTPIRHVVAFSEDGSRPPRATPHLVPSTFVRTYANYLDLEKLLTPLEHDGAGAATDVLPIR